MTSRVLFDQGVPAPLRKHLINSTVDTVYERGWSTLENGDLINKAEVGLYDIFVTTDKNLKYQQNISTRAIAIVVLPTPSWPVLKNQVDRVVNGISSVSKNSYLEISLDEST